MWIRRIAQVVWLVAIACWLGWLGALVLLLTVLMLAAPLDWGLPLALWTLIGGVVSGRILVWLYGEVLTYVERHVTQILEEHDSGFPQAYGRRTTPTPRQRGLTRLHRLPRDRYA